MTQIKLIETLATATGGAVDLSGLRSPTLSYQATVAGTGAVSATVIVEVSMDRIGWVTDATSTMPLSGTTVSSAGFNSNGAWDYARARVTAVSGTGALVTVTVGG
jgi:hypothetical protein